MVDEVSGGVLGSAQGASVTVTGVDAYGEHIALNTVLRDDSVGVFSFSSSLLALYYATLACPGYVMQEVSFANSQDPLPSVVDYLMSSTTPTPPPPEPEPEIPADIISTITVNCANPWGGTPILVSYDAANVGYFRDDGTVVMWGFRYAENLGVQFAPIERYELGATYLDGVRFWGAEKWVATSSSHVFDITWNYVGGPEPPPPGPVEEIYMYDYRGYQVYQDTLGGWIAYLDGVRALSALDEVLLLALIDNAVGPEPPEPPPEPVPPPPVPPVPGGSLVDRINYAMGAYGLSFAVAVLFALGLYEIANKKK